MSRPLRLEHAGALWHVTARGNERRAIFRDDADRREFLAVLARVVGTYRWCLHAYVLMGNHYHLLFETPEPTLSRGMRQLNGIYTQRFNRRHSRVGHLLQGRFHAVLVERDAHLLELARYVVLNPVRAGLVKSAAGWAWSSYRATAGLERPPSWLDVRPLQDAFDGARARALERYRSFVSEGRESGYDPWDELRGQIYLGSDLFRADIVARFTRGPLSDEIPRAQRKAQRAGDPARELERLLGIGLGALRARPRKLVRERRMAARYLHHERLMTFREIGSLLGVRGWQASALARADGDEPSSRRRPASHTT